MKIDNEKANEYIKKINVNACPLCGKRNWIISDTVFQMPEYNQKGIMIGGNSSTFPIITITCSNCGNTYIVNAIIAGLVEQNSQGDKNE